jgi:hypothetical protein
MKWCSHPSELGLRQNSHRGTSSQTKGGCLVPFWTWGNYGSPALGQPHQQGVMVTTLNR